MPRYSPSFTIKVTEYVGFYSSYIRLKVRKLARHVHTTHDCIWAFAPYSCTGCGWFLLQSWAHCSLVRNAIHDVHSGFSSIDIHHAQGLSTFLLFLKPLQSEDDCLTTRMPEAQYGRPGGQSHLTLRVSTYDIVIIDSIDHNTCSNCNNIGRQMLAMKA